MNEHSDAWTDRLSEYVDGGLDGDERERLERHLRTCLTCRGVIEDLRAVKERAAALGGVEPPRDLWPAIESAIEAGKVVALEGARPRRGLFLSFPQLAAAAMAVMALGGAGAWFVSAGPPPPVPPEFTVEAPSAVPGVLAGLDDPRFADQAAEVERLRTLLAEERARLDPNAVRILEKNLAVIDRAIRESYEALGVDPGNEFVEEHLRRSVERKVIYLREAAALLEMTD